MEYLVNSFGRIIETDDPARIKKLLNSKTMRKATQVEIDKHLERQLQAVHSQAPPTGGIAALFQSVQSYSDGYGSSRNLIMSSLMKEGVYLSENYRDQKVGLLYNYPYTVQQMPTDVRLVYTMFESNKIPDEWIEDLKAADEVIVPSKFCADTFARAGIDTTIVPLGYDDREFIYKDRPIPVETGEDFVFIHYGSFNIRKGFLEVVKAFTEEFKKSEPAKLILKTVQDKTLIPFVKGEYPNIEVVRGDLSEADLWQLLARSHCMVYPSRGEGFGITPLEAMATGIPAIVPNAHGISEYFNGEYMIEVKADEVVPPTYNRFRGQDVGNMVAADVADLRKKMRFAFNHQADCKRLGKAASEYVKRYTYRSTAEQLAAIIKRWDGAEVKRRPEAKVLKVERV